jgi:hypothetical protein
MLSAWNQNGFFSTRLSVFFVLLFAPLCLSTPSRAAPDGTQAQPSISRFEQVSFDLYRGAQPVGIEFNQLEEFGIRTVMSFVKKPAKVVEDERVRVEELGMRFFSFPMDTYAGPKKETLAAIFEELGREENWPIYIHCNNGKNRTGLIAGLYRVHFDYWNAHAAYREMKSKGFNPLLLGLTWNFWTNSHPGDLAPISQAF